MKAELYLSLVSVSSPDYINFQIHITEILYDRHKMSVYSYCSLFMFRQ